MDQTKTHYQDHRKDAYIVEFKQTQCVQVHKPTAILISEAEALQIGDPTRFEDTTHLFPSSQWKIREQREDRESAVARCGTQTPFPPQVPGEREREREREREYLVWMPMSSGHLRARSATDRVPSYGRRMRDLSRDMV